MTLTVKDSTGATVSLKTVTESAEEVPYHAISTANGAGVTIGTTSDAAVTTNTTGTLSGKVRGLVAILADVWDSVNHRIGVAVGSLPADPLGANADAAATAGGTGSLSSKLRTITDGIGTSLDSLIAAGSTGSLSSKLRIISDTLGGQGDSAVTTNTSGPVSGKLRGIVALLAAAIDLSNGFIKSQLLPFTSGGLSNYHVVAAATTNAANIKASAGQVYAWNIFNNAAYPVYVKFHNSSGTPTAGSGVVHTVGVPAGGGNNWNSDIGFPFATGIAITIVKDIADAGATAVAASDCVVDVKYK